MIATRETPIRVEGISSELVRHVRDTMRDPFGNQLRVRTVDSTAPCRHCLRIAPPGSRMILFAYRPFPPDFGPYAETGPVFVHAGPCERYQDVTALPSGYRERELVVRAYNDANEIEESVIVRATDALGQAAAFYAQAEIAFVHARHPAYGCFAFEIRR